MSPGTRARWFVVSIRHASVPLRRRQLASRIHTLGPYASIRTTATATGERTGKLLTLSRPTAIVPPVDVTAFPRIGRSVDPTSSRSPHHSPTVNPLPQDGADFPATTLHSINRAPQRSILRQPRSL